MISRRRQLPPICCCRATRRLSTRKRSRINGWVAVAISGSIPKNALACAHTGITSALGVCPWPMPRFDPVSSRAGQPRLFTPGESTGPYCCFASISLSQLKKSNLTRTGYTLTRFLTRKHFYPPDWIFSLTAGAPARCHGPLRYWLYRLLS